MQMKFMEKVGWNTSRSGPLEKSLGSLLYTCLADQTGLPTKKLFPLSPAAVLSLVSFQGAQREPVNLVQLPWEEDGDPKDGGFLFSILGLAGMQTKSQLCTGWPWLDFDIIVFNFLSASGYLVWAERWKKSKKNNNILNPPSLSY